MKNHDEKTEIIFIGNNVYLISERAKETVMYSPPAGAVSVFAIRKFNSDTVAVVRSRRKRKA